MSGFDDSILAACIGKRAGNSGWIRIDCPACELVIGKADRKRCMGVSVLSGRFHCFAAGTLVTTWQGPVPIERLQHKMSRVLTTTSDGKSSRWVDTLFRSYGVQNVFDIELSRNGVRKIVRATGGHRWFVVNSRGNQVEMTTTDLRTGNRLRSIRPPRSWTTLPSPWGIAHGFTYGDGTRPGDGSGSLVNCWGDKDAEMLSWFPLSHKRAIAVGDLNGTAVDGLPNFFKSLPSLNESRSYLYGWLAGYFAADGSVRDDGHPRLASADRKNLEFVQQLCLRVGIVTYDIASQIRRGLGSADSALYSLSFSRRIFTKEFFLLSHHRQRWLANKDAKERPGWVVRSVVPSGSEEVFCTEIGGSGSFALDGGILTGNCWRCATSGRIKNFDPELFDSSLYVPKSDDGPQEIDPPEGYLALAEEPALSAAATEEAWRYLEGRGLTFDMIQEKQIGVCLSGRYHGRVIVPLLGSDGAWLWWVGRSFTKKAEKPYIYPSGGRSGLLYNHQALLKKTDDPVGVVEGVFDSLFMQSVQLDASAVLGKPNEDQIEAFLASPRPIAIVLDGDAWQLAMALAMRLRFEGKRAGFVKLPPTKDPDEVDVAWLRQEMVRCLDE